MLGAPVVFVPPTESNLHDWHDAAYGITLNSGDVSSWLDKCGDASHALVQANATYRPLYTAADAAYNDKPTITFDGSDECLESGNWTLARQWPMTVYIVGHLVSVTSDWMCLVEYFMVDGQYHYDHAVNSSEHFVAYNEGNGSIVTTTHISNPSVICACINSTSSYVAINTTTKTTGTIGGLHSLDQMVVGRTHVNYGTQHANCTLAHVLTYYAAHDDSTRASIMNALGTYYGITIS
jgi:hypothetical protein